jgi:hypothetical protein
MPKISSAMVVENDKSAVVKSSAPDTAKISPDGTIFRALAFTGMEILLSADSVGLVSVNGAAPSWISSIE